LASFRINFQASLSLAVFLQPLLHTFSSDHFQYRQIISFMAFQRTLFHSGTFLNTWFTDLSSGALSSCLSRNNLHFLIFKVISVSLHRSILVSIMTDCAFVATSDTYYRVSSVQIRVDDEQSFACRNFPSFFVKTHPV